VITAAVWGGYLFGDRLLPLGGNGEPWVTVAAPQPGPMTPSPSPSPSPAEPSPPPKGRLVIHGTGDVSLDPSYIPNLAANGYAYAWSGLGGLFMRDDLTVVNLECPASDLGAAVDKEFTFRCDPAALDEMRAAGVEVANQGNNHAYDYGPEALVDSVRRLRAADVAPVGAGPNQGRALRPVTFRLDGRRVAVLGFGMVVDPAFSVAGEETPGIAAGYDTDLMLRSIRRAERRADLVVVTIHWGVELDTEPRPEQVELGHAFVDAGADVVFGHHARRLQPLEHFRGRPIFWGLGNFVWPNFSPEGSTTAVARAVVTPDGDIRGRLLPAFIEAPGHPVLTR
jgi:poly-gamma-glutamate capsule biosynthesis protein CapA/YwtB (metallophosphatase superfamily)